MLEIGSHKNLNNMLSVKLFSYVFLQTPEIKIELFGKEIFETIDSLSGYKISKISFITK